MREAVALVRVWALLFVVLLVSLPAQADEIVLWHAYRDAEEGALQEAAKAFELESGHQVELVAIPFGAFASKLETAIPRGNGPDLFIASHDQLGKWTGMGLVQAVAEVAPEHTPASVEAMRWEGQIWGRPLAYKSLLLFYDPTKISAAPRTTDEMLELARKHTGDGSYGLAYQASEPYFHAPWVHAFGGAAYDENGEVHLDAKPHVDALTFAARLALEEKVVPQQPTAQLIAQLYSDGNAAMVISGPWFLAGLDREIAAAPLPIVSETGLPARPYLTVEGVFLAAQAQHAVPAGALAEFLSGRSGAQIRQATARQAVTWQGLDVDDPLLAALAEQARTAVPMPADPGVANVFEAQARALRKVLRGASEPQAAMDGAQTYYRILSKPPPPAVSPLPYLILIGLTALGALAWASAPLRDPYERARLWTHRWDYLWIGPAGFSLGLLVVVPFLTGAGVAFFAHDAGEWTFVGLSNFADIVLARDWPVTSPMSFFYTLTVTVLWTVTNLVLHVGLGVALALILREPWIRMRAVWRALLIIPWAVPNYITALIWKGMFHAQYGAVNALLGVFAGRNVEFDWFASFARAFTANLVTNTWLGFPFMMVVTLGALQSIPRDLEEAAEVDGASWMFRFRHVVWPLLQPALLPAIILGSVWTFNMFNVIYLMSAGEPDGSTEILISEAYRWAFSRGNRYGYAAAYAVLIFFVLLAYSRGANRLVGKKVL